MRWCTKVQGNEKNITCTCQNNDKKAAVGSVPKLRHFELEFSLRNNLQQSLRPTKIERQIIYGTALENEHCWRTIPFFSQSSSTSWPQLKSSTSVSYYHHTFVSSCHSLHHRRVTEKFCEWETIEEGEEGKKGKSRGERRIL